MVISTSADLRWNFWAFRCLSAIRPSSSSYATQVSFNYNNNNKFFSKFSSRLSSITMLNTNSSYKACSISYDNKNNLFFHRHHQQQQSIINSTCHSSSIFNLFNVNMTQVYRMLASSSLLFLTLMAVALFSTQHAFAGSYGRMGGGGSSSSSSSNSRSRSSSSSSSSRSSSSSSKPSTTSSSSSRTYNYYNYKNYDYDYDDEGNLICSCYKKKKHRPESCANCNCYEKKKEGSNHDTTTTISSSSDDCNCKNEKKKEGSNHDTTTTISSSSDDCNCNCHIPCKCSCHVPLNFKHSLIFFCIVIVISLFSFLEENNILSDDTYEDNMLQTYDYPIKMVDNRWGSVLMVQVGILDKNRELQRKLNRIAGTADTVTMSGLNHLLKEVVKALLQHHDCCHFAYLFTKYDHMEKYSRPCFREFLETELGKFVNDEETFVNVDGVKCKNVAVETINGIDNEYSVVTLLVLADGEYSFPSLKWYTPHVKKVDVKTALQTIHSILKINLEAVEVLWTPQTENDSVSEQKIRRDFGLLMRPVNLN